VSTRIRHWIIGISIAFVGSLIARPFLSVAKGIGRKTLDEIDFVIDAQVPGPVADAKVTGFRGRKTPLERTQGSWIGYHPRNSCPTAIRHIHKPARPTWMEYAAFSMYLPPAHRMSGFITPVACELKAVGAPNSLHRSVKLLLE
jgi:hypothetical protein